MSHADDGTLHAYLDGQLSPVELAQLEAHLASCPACRGRLDEERALIERADILLATAVPPERALPPFHGLRHPRPLMRFRLPLAWAATVLLAVGAGWYVGVRSYRREGSSAAPVAGLVASGVDTAPRAYLAQRQGAAPPPARRDAPRSAEPTPPAARPAVPAQARESTPPGNFVVDGRALAIAPGVVSARPPAELKSADAPLPAAPNLVVMERARRAPVVLTTSWQIIGLDAARPTLGTNPVTIPGLPVRDVRRSPLGDGVVVVEQALDSTTVIQLFQRRADLERTLEGQAAGEGGRPFRAAAPAQAARPAPRDTMTAQARGYLTVPAVERLARYVGSLRVEIAGPLSADSLSKLLDLVK